MPGNPKRPSDQANSRRGPILIGLGIVGVLAIVGVAALVWYFNQPVPEEVTLEEAVADVATTSTAAASDTVTTSDTAAPTEGTEGTWSVDTSIGEFSFEDATSSFVGFRIDEELATIGATTAVGRTPAVAGTLTLAGTSITDTVIEADLTAIVTNADRRNRAVQRALNTASFPTATFTLTEPVDLGAIPIEGGSVTMTAKGNLKINGVTKSIKMPLEAQLVSDAAGGLIVVVGSVDIAFADWDVAVPSAPVVVSVADHGILELQLFFTRS